MKRKLKPSAETVTPIRKYRCAVYTRVSTDENLDQAYNSLHAQKDSGLAYIRSQQAEGWDLIPDDYDDAGFSGGTLDRPALKRLIADVKADRVDVIVTYKLDRLSRSLMDFAKLVEIFEAHGVTFVSVTQSFNTTTSMGRLTLHILLSFAQFEREVIGERIRDKFAASRARGLWMGGKIPFGFDVKDRKLVVNVTEAAIVRRVFEGFIETGSGTKLTQALHIEGVTTRSGKPIDKGVIYKMLSNRVYAGEVEHKGIAYSGEHEAIIDRDLWDQVHAILHESPRARSNKNRAQSPALLRGLIFDTSGRALSPTFTRRRGRLYRYYVNQAVLKATDDGDSNLVRRIPAAEIETAVIEQMRVMLRQPELLIGTWLAAREELPDLTENGVREALWQLDPLWDQLFPAERNRIVRLLIERVEVGSAGADIRLRIEGLTSLVKDLGVQTLDQSGASA